LEQSTSVQKIIYEGRVPNNNYAVLMLTKYDIVTTM